MIIVTFCFYVKLNIERALKGRTFPPALEWRPFNSLLMEEIRKGTTGAVGKANIEWKNTIIKQDSPTVFKAKNILNQLKLVMPVKRCSLMDGAVGQSKYLPRRYKGTKQLVSMFQQCHRGLYSW